MIIDTKLHVIHNELKRISERCTHKEDLKISIENFKNILKINNYPDIFLKHQLKKKFKNKNKRNTSNDDYLYLKFPYLGNKIQNIFRKLNLPIRTYDHHHTLRTALTSKSNTSCRLNNCKLKAIVENKPYLCNIKNCVYEIICKCGNNYIGSTHNTMNT